MAKLLSGVARNGKGALEPVPPAEMLALLAGLSARYPEEFTIRPATE